jgi:hypothetical protein
VRTFRELQDAINGDGDNKLIKLSGTIVFTEQIVLPSTNSGGDRQLETTVIDRGSTKFKCPTCDCIFNGESNNRLFHIKEGAGDVAFRGVTFKNGSAPGVSPE